MDWILPVLVTVLVLYTIGLLVLPSPREPRRRRKERKR